ncbi:hypothetical protein FA10DRAFT_303170 [Acaromyces ingoldii]|uniref:Ste24 endopeptidase n=1 Tax=Acaromyces ingoldii TaxID=215250 RepID=A0A316YGC0_9BASI|nr:hypothetical protein FA10DRAFT_303170 [Acaromyces ingoldii]PWN88181.1 hypothetical protein FA10DRAFT_303170 [Acaromyces ingoldii]
MDAVTTSIARLQLALDDDRIPWISTIHVLLLSVLAFELFVSLRQLRQYRKPAPPPTLAPHVSLETFEKSRAYGRDKLRFSLVTMVLEWALAATLISLHAYARVWNVAGHVMTLLGYKSDGEIPHSLLFLLISQLITSVPMLPVSLYRHFVLEEKHGFNKMTLGTFFIDGVKEWFVGVCLVGPLMAGLIKLIRWAGDGFVAYVVVFLFAFQIIAMVLYPTLIQPLFNKLTPLPEGALRDRVVALARQLKFPLKSIYVIDGSKRSAHSNAYFYGAIPGGSKHIVIYDTLIEKSTPDEIEAVLAHELGHWAHSDPAKLLTLGQMQIVLSMSLFTLFIHNASLFRAFGFNLSTTAGIAAKISEASHQITGTINAASSVQVGYLPIVIGFELFQLVLSPTDSLLKFAINAAVRRMEYAADRFAALQPRAPATEAEKRAAEVYNANDVLPGEKPVDVHDKESYITLLGRALIKLHVQNLATMHHDPLYSAYHYSHPSLAERLSELEKIEARQAKKAE